MSKKRKKPTVPNTSDILVLFGTVADTTWRMFVPTLGGLVFGMWADSTFHTKPMYTIAGVMVGVIVCLGLIYIQLKGVSKK